MDKVIEALKSNQAIAGFFAKVVFELIVMVVILYSGMQTLTTKFEIYEKVETDLASRVLVLEKKTAYDDGSVYGKLESISKRLDAYDSKFEAITRALVEIDALKKKIENLEK